MRQSFIVIKGDSLRSFQGKAKYRENMVFFLVKTGDVIKQVCGYFSIHSTKIMKRLYGYIHVFPLVVWFCIF